MTSFRNQVISRNRGIYPFSPSFWCQNKCKWSIFNSHQHDFQRIFQSYTIKPDRMCWDSAISVKLQFFKSEVPPSSVREIPFHPISFCQITSKSFSILGTLSYLKIPTLSTTCSECVCATILGRSWESWEFRFLEITFMKSRGSIYLRWQFSNNQQWTVNLFSAGVA